MMEFSVSAYRVPNSETSSFADSIMSYLPVMEVSASERDPSLEEVVVACTPISTISLVME